MRRYALARVLMVSPEHELLLCCRSSAASPPAERRIHELIQRDIDWAEVFRSARRHGIAPLLRRMLADVHVTSIPADVYESFDGHVIASGMQAGMLIRWSADTLRLFESEGCRTLVFKGASLAKLAYGDVALRRFQDLDLLVHRDDYEGAGQLLLRHGYQQHADHGWERTFLGEARVPVDLHVSLTPAIFPFPLDFDRWWGRRQFVDVDGCQMPTLSDEDLLIVLAVQISKDAASRTLLLAKIYDFAHLMTNDRGLDWRAVRDEASRLRVRGMLAFAIGMTATLLPGPIPEQAAAIMPPTARLRRLIARQVEEIFRVRAGRAPTTRRLISFHWQVRESMRDRLWPFVAIPLKAATPNKWDRAVIRLPASLFALYYIIRPMRLVWKYARPRAIIRAVAAARGGRQ
jgi:Uncharacterised nucleotidyltransferase